MSATETGRRWFPFGARAKSRWRYELRHPNGGKDEKFMDKQGNHDAVGPEYAPITSEYLDDDERLHKFDMMMDWLGASSTSTS